MIRRIALAVPLVGLAALSLSAQGPPGGALTAELPIRRVVLYKTGVGYFEHLGTVTGNQQLAVRFSGDQLDDVLKSLTAVDLGNGRVTGVSYDSPTPIERQLEALQLPLGQGATTMQLLAALRGSRVEVRGPTGAVVTGRLLNAESRVTQPGEPPVERDEISLVTDGGDLVTMPVNANTRIRVADANRRQDLGRYLDITATNGTRSPRRMVISTSGSGARQFLVSYVSEAAVWKTTYRLVFPTAGDRAPLLQGWAVVDNVSASDWTDVELSLVAGAPQAFKQALSQPLFAARPSVAVGTGTALVPETHAAALLVGTARITGIARDVSGAALPGVSVDLLDDENRVATSVTDAAGRYLIAGVPGAEYTLQATLPGFTTVRLDVALSANRVIQRNLELSVGSLAETITVGASQLRRSNSGGAGGGTYRGAAPPAAPAPAPAAPPQAVIEQAVLDQAAAARGADLGELFEYKLSDRVTIRRNQSALVPILHAPITAERVSLWNDGMGLRPRRAVWLKNTSSLTLDAGSLSIVDGGAFAGEGLIDPVKPNERRLVSYASDLGLQVSARQGDSPTRIVRVRIAKGVVTQESQQRRRRVYTARNDDRDARVVLIEHPVMTGWTLASTLTPEETTAVVHRFRLTVPSGQTSTLEVDETSAGSVRYSVGELDGNRLTFLVQGGGNRAALEQALAPVTAKLAEVAQAQEELARREVEIASIDQDQTRLRENMKALKDSSAERRLLTRYAGQLEAQETRLDTLKRELASITDRLGRLQSELADATARVTLDLAF
jgi:hypothetical protein